MLFNFNFVLEYLLNFVDYFYLTFITILQKKNGYVLKLRLKDKLDPRDQF